MNRSLQALLNNPEKLQPMLQRLPAVVSLVLVIAIAHILSQITWLLLAEPAEPVLKSAPVQVKTSATSSSQQSFRVLTSAHLFGTMEVAQTSQTTTAAPDTKLNLVLRGVLASDPTTMASAIISSGKGGKEEIYGLGDKMPGGVTLKEIHPEHVILERQGKLETLRLLRDETDDGKIDLSNVEPISSTGSSLDFSSPGEALTSIREEILSNPTSFGDYALPVIVKEDGKQIGYRLQPQKKGEMLGELGLEASDIITEINGVKLDQPQNGMSALRTLSTANEINLVVKRNGAEVPLNIQLQ